MSAEEVVLKENKTKVSPDYARISMAAAIQLGLKDGKFYRDIECGCINLLQVYPEGCYANCSYCGLARERPGNAEENSFIRVSWPLYSMETLANSIADLEKSKGVGRVCISQVHDPKTNKDILEMAGLINTTAPDVPIAALINASTMDEETLLLLKKYGVDKIGFGLDGASEPIFNKHRGKERRGPHTWQKYFKIISLARELYGPYNVNCHIIVGLGETDKELAEINFQLYAQKVEVYLFSFNSEPGSALQDWERQPIKRHRRVQLMKYLIENNLATENDLLFDAEGNLIKINLPVNVIDEVIDSGFPFMTDGCPDRQGEMTCNRPFGSYRPGEEFRDYPFLPEEQDLVEIRNQMVIEEIL
ncbi:MAG: radical SAM protein [Ignavibacteriaceae bacterium]